MLNQRSTGLATDEINLERGLASPYCVVVAGSTAYFYI